MDLNNARNMALILMAQHGLDTPSGWVFQWDNARRRFGSCHWDKKIITLSQRLTLLNPVEHVRATVLHEIAHALAPRNVGHGPAWRRIALALGDDGARCYGAEVLTPARRFRGLCPNCAKTVERHSRKRSLACGACCRKFNGGKHSPAYQFTWERI